MTWPLLRAIFLREWAQGVRQPADLAARNVVGGGAIVLTSHQPLPADFPSSQKLILRLPIQREQLSMKEHA